MRKKPTIKNVIKESAEGYKKRLPEEDEDIDEVIGSFGDNDD